MNKSHLRIVFPILVALGGVAWCARARGPAPVAADPSTPNAVGFESLPLLDDLKKGSTVGEWELVRIELRGDETGTKALWVDFERKGSGVSVWIERKGNAKTPPIETKKYAISHGMPKPFGEPIPQDAYGSLSAKVEERVRRTEDTAPTPDGL